MPQKFRKSVEQVEMTVIRFLVTMINSGKKATCCPFEASYNITCFKKERDIICFYNSLVTFLKATK